jgi:hypothetical protein
MSSCPKRFGIYLKLQVGNADATGLLGGSPDDRINDKMVVQNIPQQDDAPGAWTIFMRRMSSGMAR